jgi:hypothetical protein
LLARDIVRITAKLLQKILSLQLDSPGVQLIALLNLLARLRRSFREGGSRGFARHWPANFLAGCLAHWSRVRSNRRLGLEGLLSAPSRPAQRDAAKLFFSPRKGDVRPRFGSAYSGAGKPGIEPVEAERNAVSEGIPSKDFSEIWRNPQGHSAAGLTHTGFVFNWLQGDAVAFLPPAAQRGAKRLRFEFQSEISAQLLWKLPSLMADAAPPVAAAV